MKITLIRHGITEGNAQRLYYGRTDLPLAGEGEAELIEMAKRCDYPKAERYFTSGLLRAEQSFKALFGEIEHGILTDMQEIDLGDFEMRSFDELQTDPVFLEWIEGDNENNRCPNGESGNEATERALHALQELVSDGRDALVITHGGIIGGVMARLFPAPAGRYAYSSNNGEGFTICFENGLARSWSLAPTEKRNEHV